MRNVSIADWSTLLKQIYRYARCDSRPPEMGVLLMLHWFKTSHTKPGGYVEISDLEGIITLHYGGGAANQAQQPYTATTARCLKTMGL